MKEVIDCKSEEGITIGLIDSLISISRVLKPRLDNKNSYQIEEAIKDLSTTSDLLEIVNKEFFKENRVKVKRGEREFKEGTILTNGRQFIKLTYKSSRDWTPSNNHGRKRANYWGCTFFNISSKDNEWYYQFNDGEVAGLWLQEGYGLFEFRPINSKLIDKDILNKLNRKK